MMSDNTTVNWILNWCASVGLRNENRGNVAAILITLRRMRTDQKLRNELFQILRSIDNPRWRGFAALSLFVTRNEGQIAGITGPNVTQILREHGITGRYLGVDGGRTSRGNFRYVRDLLSHLPADKVSELSSDEIERLAMSWEDSVIEQFVRPELQPDPIIIENQTSVDASLLIGAILDAAGERSLAGPVAQHLVGAKLQRRHENLSIENYACFAQDASSQRNADFTVHTYAYHVTVAPTKSLVRRWEQNTVEGLRSRVLVRERQVASTRELLKQETTRHIAVIGIETFVGTNVDEMATDAGSDSAAVLTDVINIYNHRIAQVERDATGMEILLTS